MSQSFRPLLPALPSGGESSNDSSLSGQHLHKRTATRAACEECRKRKSKCSAERPRCATCVERGIPCEYKTLPTETHTSAQKRRLRDMETRCDAYEDLFNILRTRQESEAKSIFQRVRTGDDVEVIVRSIGDGDLLLQLAAQPNFHFRYEFPYIREMPRFLEDEGWFNPYLKSALYQKILTLPPPSHPPATESLGHQDDYQKMYMFPYHTVKLADNSLDHLDVAKWTAITSNNTLLRKLLEIYFLLEYPFNPFFSKDLFLNDMIGGNERFCSSLLVNAILAAAWHGYHMKSRADHWRPDNFGYRFLAEAQRLLIREQNTAKITTAQAAAIINLTYNINGLDEVSWPYLRVAIEMAQQLNIFTLSADSDPSWRVAAVTTSWGLFNWQALVSFHSFQAPMLSGPPSHPLPHPGTDPHFYGDLHVKYPDGTTLNTCHGQIFKAVSEFRVIINDVGREAFTNGRDRLTVTRAYEVRRRLGAWYSSFTGMLKAEKIALPCHLKVHMHLHVLLICMFEPYENGDGPSNADNSPSQIVAQSKACFESLMRLYYLRHGFESFDTTLLQFMPMLAWSSLRDYIEMKNTGHEHMDAMRSTVILCGKGLWEQGRNYSAAEVIYWLFEKSLPSKKEVQLLRDATDIDGEDDGLTRMVREVRSNWPIGLFSAARANVEQSRLGRFINYIIG